MDALAHPLKAVMVGLRGPQVVGPMAPEIDMTHQRKADYGLHERHVAQVLAEIYAPSSARRRNRRERLEHKNDFPIPHGRA